MCPLLIVCWAIYLHVYLGIYPSPHSFLTYLLWWIHSLRAAAPRMEKPMTTPHPRSPSSKGKADQSPDIYPWDWEKQVGCFLPVLSPYLYMVSLIDTSALSTPAWFHVLKLHITFLAWEVSGLSWLRSHMGSFEKNRAPA